jgi:hypothetical protein
MTGTTPTSTYQRTLTAGATARRCLGALLLVLAGVTPAYAEVTLRDLQIVARTMGFLDPPLTGEVRVGIIHDPGQPASLEQALAIANLMGSGLRSGNLVLRPELVALPDAMTAQVRFFLLPGALGNNASALQLATKNRQLPCLTTDLDQVRAGNCTIGIQSLPKVEILVNRQEAVAREMKFATVFRMMITEL